MQLFRTEWQHYLLRFYKLCKVLPTFEGLATQSYKGGSAPGALNAFPERLAQTYYGRGSAACDLTTTQRAVAKRQCLRMHTTRGKHATYTRPP